MKNNLWPYAIIAYFVVFISGIVAWVTFASRHNDQLVRPDYYDHEIEYQAQIDRVTRTRALNGESVIAYNLAEKNVRITLPPEMRGKNLEGTIHLYRPSDARLDKRIPLSPSVDGAQQINVGDLKEGLWKLRLDWQSGDAEYYVEKSLVLGGN
jgi:nitrogen fixation protein FixH